MSQILAHLDKEMSELRRFVPKDVTVPRCVIFLFTFPSKNWSASALHTQAQA